MHNKKKASAKAGQKLKHADFLPKACRPQVRRLTRSTSRAQNEGSLKLVGRNQTASSTQPSGFLFCPQRMLMDCSRQQSVDRQWGLRVSVRTRRRPMRPRDNPRQFSGGSLNLKLIGGHMAITIKTRNAGSNERTPRLFPLSLRLAAYRGLRHITGPALAFRGAFRVGGAK